MASRLTPVATPVVRPEEPTADGGADTRLAQARAVLELESGAIASLATHLDDSFCRAADLLQCCTGRVIVTGVGKSGHVARKLAATFSCVGTPSLFLHAAEAAHGDLGMVARGDVLLIISKSGEVDELKRIVPSFREREIPIVAVVGRKSSTLGRWADVVLEAPVEREACPHDLIPTTSAIAAMALGDALAMALLDARGFTAEQFASLHPGGSLGRDLSSRVHDSMLTTDLPFVSTDTPVGDALVIMTSGCCGLAIVVDEDRQLLGVVTDGDLRRALQRREDLRQLPISEIMTRDPVTISEGGTLHEAQARMLRLKLQSLIVLDAERRVTGVIQIFNGS